MAASIPTAKIDRETTVPFYLKLFYKTGGFNRLEEFISPTDLPPHVEIYTWQSCTLRELSHLLASAYPQLLPDPAIGTRLSFRLIFPDTHVRAPRHDGAGGGPPKYMVKELGTLVIGDEGEGGGVLPEDEETASIVAGGPMAGNLHGDSEKTLQDARFVIGDYVACAIMEPLRDGAVAPPPSGPARGGYGGRAGMGGEFGGGRGRENGFGRGGGGFGGRGGRGSGNFGGGFVPTGEWRRGERVPEGPASRGRGSGVGFGGRGRY